MFTTSLRPIRLTPAILAAVTILVCAAASAYAARVAPDETIRQRVLAKLSGQITLHPEGLEVAVQGGEVRLGGSVASLGEKRSAARIAQGVVGVTSVTNDLSIRPSTQSDTAVLQEVRRMLDRRPRLRSGQIDVNVANGSVSLSGAVDRALDRLEAEEAASSVAGVSSVHSELRVRSEGTVAPSTIRARVRSILGNRLTFGVIRDLQVDVEGGSVVLKGVVAREADRDQAERLALGVPGVTEVTNQIKVEHS